MGQDQGLVQGPETDQGLGEVQDPDTGRGLGKVQGPDTGQGLGKVQDQDTAQVRGKGQVPGKVRAQAQVPVADPVPSLGTAACSTAVRTDRDMGDTADRVGMVGMVGMVDKVILPRLHLKDTAGWVDKVHLEGKGAGTPLESPCA
jgi:hypothetical protein